MLWKDFELFHKLLHQTAIEICGALRDLVPFVQFKKREKHPRKSVTYGAKLRNAPHIAGAGKILLSWHFATIKHHKGFLKTHLPTKNVKAKFCRTI